MRLDGVTTPPILITAGKSWTLVSAADGFWMVHVAWQVPGEPTDTRPTPWSRVPDDITAVAADQRGRFVHWERIRSVRIRMRRSDAGDRYPSVHLRGRVWHRRLDFRQADRAAVEAFFEPVIRRSP